MTIIHEKNNRWISLIAEPLHLSFYPLQSGNRYKVELIRHSVTKNQLIKRVSYAQFIADEHGKIDLATAKPYEGTYTETDAMGLFWSMQIEEQIENKSEPYIRLNPHEYEIALYRDNICLDKKIIVKKWYKDEKVDSIPINGDGLIGRYYYHRDYKVRPSLIVVSGSEGGTNDFAASALTAYGFNTLALAYFGEEGLNDRLVEVPLELIENAIIWLTNRRDAHPNWIGIHGTSRGGELALWSAVLFDEITAAVSLNGSAVSFAGIVPWSEERTLPPAWNFRGQALPYASKENPVEVASYCRARWMKGGNPLSYWYDCLYELNKAIIPIEETKKEFLLISGKEDANFRSSVFHDVCTHEHIQKHFYEAAGHEIGIPYLPIVANGFTGGTKAQTAKASVHSWEETIDFLRRSFAKKLGDK
ncbi:acyl-CoA thioesterase/bile acid-CoA:amino acid N-acyltransferase family protein [Cytobacillus sp. FSL W7-1323]|uniref:acyl-CoA thioesterase/bile acid-CoA:amino acid N-acyltransferase family protein n=1 Tax=Cytobacillus sp. FSL W7-1323 TaxID=2921700 RepID=UPI003158D23D